MFKSRDKSILALEEEINSKLTELDDLEKQWLSLINTRNNKLEKKQLEQTITLLKQEINLLVQKRDQAMLPCEFLFRLHDATPWGKQLLTYYDTLREDLANLKKYEQSILSSDSIICLISSIKDIIEKFYKRLQQPHLITEKMFEKNEYDKNY